MFYPLNSLKRGGRFYICWVADSWPLRFATITHRQLSTQDIRTICDDILKVVTNESGRPGSRFSLRLSSQLMRGLVRLYQRKTTVFLNELCVLNGLIMKNVNKKWHIAETTELGKATHTKRPLLQQLDILPQILLHGDHEEQRVEDLILNSGNTVANIQEITLRESALPELLPATDGFGEENLEQALQLAADRTLEVMLQADPIPTQHSGLELPLDITNKSQDKTRSHLEHMQMERISEYNITMFGKDIPELPDYPLPDVPVPQMTKLAVDSQLPPPQIVINQPTTSADLQRTLEIELEDISESEIQPKRRRLRNKLIVDKKIKIPGDVYRSRINDITVERRVQDCLDDVIQIGLPGELYLRRPCHIGRKVNSGISLQLHRLFQRNSGPVNKIPLAERTAEQILMRSHRVTDVSFVETIPELHEPNLQVAYELDNTRPESYSIMDNSKEGYLVRSELRKSVCDVEMDISSLVTQKIKPLSQTSQPCKRTASQMEDVNIQKKRSTGYISFKQSQKETIKDVDKSIRHMLQEAGLADKETHVDQLINERRASETSETPLGSLDRTKVSLGESDQTTDSQRFMREHWGTEGTLTKIFNYSQTGLTHVTIQSLLAKGPIRHGYRNIIAAKCFYSILNLKQYGFINIKKKQNSLEIGNITLGSKFD